MSPDLRSSGLRATAIAGAVLGTVLVLAWCTLARSPISLQQELPRDALAADDGHAWFVPALLTGWFVVATDSGGDAVSQLELTEDGRALGPPHTDHDDLRQRGGGAYSHWQGQLWFSTSDGSDPRTNGRRYAVAAPGRLSIAWLAAGGTLLALALLAWLQLLARGGRDPLRLLCRVFGSTAIAAALVTTAALLWFRLQPPVVEQQIGALTGGEVDLFGNPRPWRIPPFFRGAWPDRVWANDGAPTPVRFALLVVPSGGAFALSALLAATGVWLLLPRRRPRPHSPIGAIATLAILATPPTAATLLALDVVGDLTAPLRAPLVDLPIESSFGALDRTLGWPELRDQLDRRPGESAAAFVRRLNAAVADGIAHIWDRRFASELRLQVPASENWLLWLLGELDPRQREYFFVDPTRMLERGVGMCGQAAHALGELLADAGLDARLAQLGGHTLVAVDVDGHWWTADPDFGVVLAHGLDELAADPSLALADYTAALTRYGRCDPAAEAARLVALFDPPGNTISSGRPAEQLSVRQRRIEQLAYAVRWPVPIALLLLWLATELVGRRRAR